MRFSPSRELRRPRDETLLQNFDRIEQNNADDRQNDDGGKGERRLGLRSRNQDQIAEPLLRRHKTR